MAEFDTAGAARKFLRKGDSAYSACRVASQFNLCNQVVLLRTKAEVIRQERLNFAAEVCTHLGLLTHIAGHFSTLILYGSTHATIQVTLRTTQNEVLQRKSDLVHMEREQAEREQAHKVAQREHAHNAALDAAMQHAVSVYIDYG